MVDARAAALLEDEEDFDPERGTETWESTARGTFWIAKFVGRHGETEYVPVKGPRKFHIRPAERRLNQDLCLNDALDPFQNGTFVPVRLSETTTARERAMIEKTAAQAADPQLDAVLKGSLEDLTQRLSTIDNPTVLLRLYQRAVDLDSHSRILAVRDRLAQVSPGSIEEETPKRRVPGAVDDEPEDVSSFFSGGPSSAAEDVIARDFGSVATKGRPDVVTVGGD